MDAGHARAARAAGPSGGARRRGALRRRVHVADDARRIADDDRAHGGTERVTTAPAPTIAPRADR